MIRAYKDTMHQFYVSLALLCLVTRRTAGALMAIVNGLNIMKSGQVN